MPRQARLDAPGTLHHVMVRGIEKRKMVDDERDRQAFVGRLGVTIPAIAKALKRSGSEKVYLFDNVPL